MDIHLLPKLQQFKNEIKGLYPIIKCSIICYSTFAANKIAF